MILGVPILKHFRVSVYLSILMDKQYMDVMISCFSRCNKVLPVAESSYQENLPTHYVTSYHLRKVSLLYLGSVVQSIVSLTSSLRGQFVKCFKTL